MNEGIKPQVTLGVSLTDSGGVQVTVARACNNPAVLDSVDDILDRIRREPTVVIKDIEPELSPVTLIQKRGGPAGMPEPLKVEIVRGWLRVRGRLRAVDYAAS